mmetsp:Transcript_10899/g.45196  ORF Transcript_10899/g.45196 Transcript_10899/m.45196 type:complete len:255 (+) Transcript_10899:541-1305(+)
MATASMPLSSRYSWMLSTTPVFSAKTSTGGGDFCRHSRMCVIFASSFTYSISWITSRLAAPARPTLTTIGSTSAVSANLWIFSGMVAEKRIVWRCDLKNVKISRMSSSKPMSSMRSASSRQKYLHTSRFILRLMSRSFRRPGVATTQCTPRRTTSDCSRASMPPMHSMQRSSGMPSFTRCSAKCRTISSDWRASSRLGHTTMPKGPSPSSSGSARSPCSAVITIGRMNASDLPLPVNAMPMVSRPERIDGSACI